MAFLLTGHAQKVALVLSGGGAKAAAHVGVLKALEEHGIPVDYIVGNSMGALIAGLYASGYSPREIERMLEQPGLYDFNKSDVKKKYFYFQQHEDNASMFNIPFSFEKGVSLKLPISFYNLTEFDYQVMRYLAGPSAVANYDFDSLLIPFRCVATDIDSSKLVVFRDGDLAKAVRSSITFPFFIKPIRVKGKLMFDGGIYDNFPVDVAAKEFKPDFIIGSKAVSNYESPEADDVISQLQNLLMVKADFSIDTLNGTIIEIKSGNENIFQFQKVKQYIDSGYIATIRAIPELKKKITTWRDSGELKRKRENLINKEPELVIGNVIVKGVNTKQIRYFENSIKKHIKENTKVDEFYKQYERLLANENVRTVYPSLYYNPQSGKYDLTLDIQKTDPFNIGFGLYVSSSGVNEAYLDLGLHWLGKTSKKIDVNGYFGTFYNGVNVYAKFEKQGDIPFDVRVGFLASQRNYFSNTRFFIEDKFPAYIIIDENYADLNFGMPVGISHVLRMGISNLNINYKYYENNYFTRQDTADQSNCYFLNPYIEFERNNLNRKQYATKGSRFFLGLNFYTGNEHYIPGSKASGSEEYKKNIDFFVLKTKYEQYFNISRPFDLGITGEIEYSNKPLLGNYVSSLLLADQYEPIPVMKTLFLENYRANIYGGLGIRFIFHLFRNMDLHAEGYYYVPYQKILNVERSTEAEYSKSFSYQFVIGKVQAIYHTRLGPIGISVNYLEKNGDKFSFLFNFGYLIFNRSRFYR